MGLVESLVVEAWGLGVRIDAGDAKRPETQANGLLALIARARVVDDVARRYGCLGCPMVDGKCPACGNEEGP